MARWPQLLFVLALLAATAAAFAITERLKLERSPVTGTRVDRVFSPVCECARDVAVISIVLRRRETVTLDILNRNGRSIRTLVQELREPAGRVSYTWDGRDNLERVVAEGVYRPRVQLERNGRTIVLPNPIRVDTTAPVIGLVSVFPRVLAGLRREPRPRDGVVPDRRARAGRNARRRPPARAEQFRGSRGSSSGSGASTDVSSSGLYKIGCMRSTAPGTARVRTRAVPVRVRFVELSRERIEVAAGNRFSVRVRTDAPSIAGSSTGGEA